MPKPAQPELSGSSAAIRFNQAIATATRKEAAMKSSEKFRSNILPRAAHSFFSLAHISPAGGDSLHSTGHLNPGGIAAPPTATGGLGVVATGDPTTGHATSGLATAGFAATGFATTDS